MTGNRKKVTVTISAQNQFSEPIKLNQGYFQTHLGNTPTLVGTVSFQVAPGDVDPDDLADYWATVETWAVVSGGTLAYNGFLATESWVRVGVATGDFTSGGCDIQIAQ